MKFLVDEKYKNDPLPIEVLYHGQTYVGEAKSVSPTCEEEACFEMNVTLNNISLGLIHFNKDHWRMDDVKDEELVDAIGEEIFLWYA